MPKVKNVASNHHQILDAYQDADFSERLSMFLQMPEYRPQFVAIDQQDDRASALPGRAAAATGNRKIPGGFLHGRVAAFLNRHFCLEINC